MTSMSLFHYDKSRLAFLIDRASFGQLSPDEQQELAAIVRALPTGEAVVTTDRVARGRRDVFGVAASWATRVGGGKWAFIAAILTVVVWAAFGPYFSYSDHWQIVVNTGTTIVTFLMVFLIQNTQNRESKAIHVKLDELIFAGKRASNALINAESLSEEELDRLGKRHGRLAERSRDKERDRQALGREMEDMEQEVQEVEGRVTAVERKVEGNAAE